jgi:uncharacterized protein YggE
MTNRQTPLIISLAIIAGAFILGNNISHIWPNAGADKTITVQWEGKSSLVPNIYSFSISTNETGATTKEVSETMAKKLDQAQKILDANNIDKKDIQSSNIDIQPNRVYENNTSKEQWYRGTHTLTIKIRKIDEAGKIIDQLTAINGLLVNGGNYDQWWYWLYSRSCKERCLWKCKEESWRSCKTFRYEIGKPISISENIINNTPYPMYRAMAMDAGAESAPSTTINPGEQEMQVQLNIVFEIK